MPESLRFFLQLVISGLALGSIYALVALGFSLLYKASKILNFAQGEFISLGAFITFSLFTAWHFPWWLAILGGVAGTALLGIILEKIIFRRFIGEPVFSVVMVTIGISAMIQAVLGLTWGHETRTLKFSFVGKMVNFYDILIGQERLLAIAASVTLVIAFALFFRYSRMGIAMRATANDQETSLIMGVNVSHIMALVWAIIGAVAAFAGSFVATTQYLFPGMGNVAFRVFPAIILGGLDSIPGAIVGGFIVGLLENLGGGYLAGWLGSGAKEIVTYTLMFLIMLIRPYGLWGSREIERV